MSAPNYKKKYLDEVRPHIMKKFEFSSIMQVPKIEKITLNIGIGDAKNNKKALQSALEEFVWDSFFLFDWNSDFFSTRVIFSSTSIIKARSMFSLVLFLLPSDLPSSSWVINPLCFPLSRSLSKDFVMSFSDII